MDELTRREFLAKALLAGSGTILVSAIPGEAAPAALDAGASALDFDPDFIVGVVESVKTDGTIIASDLDSTLRVLEVLPSSRIWKAGQWNTYPVAAGDCIFARGTVGADPVFAVDKLWTNIANAYGGVASVGSRDFAFSLQNGTEVSVDVTDSTEVATADGFATGIARVMSAVSATDMAQVVGYGDLHNGPFVATRVFPTVHDAPVDPPSSDDGIMRQVSPQTSPLPPVCHETYNKLATYFCCGDVSGCGKNCSGSTSGACLDCRADRRHIAWPRMLNAGGNLCDSRCIACNCSNCPDACCCFGGVRRMACGDQVQVDAPCNGTTIYPTIHDCGPRVHCDPEFGCKNRRHVAFDLTPCAFTALGSDLSDGKVTVNVTVTFAC
jgi:hypothetical protein